ncbi:MAG: tRNA (adenosine(37)-N6)-dimethylallyltransferase MiaA [Clostridia bacterium]|nr:tRNA (adenosine(37)-N6)-dimethylallyltransferase MiaA [Clostridia bacterium]
MIPVLTIVGATASGKSAFAVKAASALGGEVVSADSMQVYKYMDIGTAKVTEDEMQGIPHHLIDVLEPDDDCNVTRFVSMAETAIEDIASRGKLPVICGGTGLYIDSLLKGAAFEDDSCDEAYREKLRTMAEEKGNEYLHSLLTEVDPVAAEKIHFNNVKRVIRALEFHHVTGRSITTQKENTVNIKYKSFIIGMERDRELLYANIDIRVDKMVEQGLFDEVKMLLNKGVNPRSNSMQGIGYREVIWYFHGKCTKDEAIRLIKRNSRRYAKRQITWFGANDSIRWINPSDDAAVDDILQIASDELRN